MDKGIVSKELASLFGLFSHPDRIRIVEELQVGELNVKQLQGILKISHSRVSQHLSQLKAHRLLNERHEGRCHYFSLAKPEMAQWILEGLQFLDTQMPDVARINRAVAEAEKGWSAETDSES